MFKGILFFIKFGWKSEKKYIIYNVLSQLFSSLIPLVTITMPKFIIDELLGLQRINHLIIYCTILIGYNLIASIALNFFRMSGFTLRIKVAAKFDLYMHEKLANADFENLENPNFLDMKEKANKFLYSDWKGFSYVLDNTLMIIGQLVTLAGIIAIIATLNIYVLIFFIILIVLTTFVESWAKKNDSKIALESVRIERRWNYFSKLFDSSIYGKEIRINNLGKWLLEQENNHSKKAIEYYKKRNNYYIKSGTFASFTAFFQQITAYGYMVYKVIDSGIGIGDFTMYVGAVSTFANSMKRVMSSIVEVKAYGIYYDAMVEYLNIPDNMRKNSKKLLKESVFEIEFKNVSFKYQGQEKYAIKNLNFKISPNKKIAIVGENGAGKTTLVKLITRMYDPTDGEILINGINIKELDYDYYMSLFSVIFQDFKLFSFSVKENIVFGNEITNEETIELIKKSGLTSKLEELNSGIDTMVHREFDEKGFEPSGGEGQKIALARALYKSSSFIILDEPTAALDPRAEFEMYQQFDNLVSGKSAIYISHRLASTKFCDFIIVLSCGELIEKGTHDNLLGQDGLYSELYNMQAKYYKEV